MTEQPGPSSRRRRRRATAAAGAAPPRESPDNSASAVLPDAATSGPSTAAPQPAASGSSATSPQPAARRQRPQRDSAERGLRDLIGAGRSQLGVSGALRGRDVNRPSEADLAEAEKTTVIVRRHWQPSDKQ